MIDNFMTGEHSTLRLDGGADGRRCPYSSQDGEETPESRGTQPLANLGTAFDTASLTTEWSTGSRCKRRG